VGVGVNEFNPFHQKQSAQSPKMSIQNFDKVRTAIKAILDKPGYDDGSIGPILVRLAWHACGTYDLKTNSGGINMV
jgi:catalase (peroxidase I)